MQLKSGADIWSRIWAETNNVDKIQQCVELEEKGIRSKKIISYIEKYLGNMNGLNSIELGSGGGIYSLIFARHETSVTLLDYCEDALAFARRNFDSLQLPATFVCLDVLNLNPDLRGKFDVAMSFGTIEHYRYPERFLMALAHFELVRPGGIVIISVPNRWFLPQEALQFYLQLKDKWKFGYQSSFSKYELFKLAKRMKLKNIEVCGSGLIADIFKFHLIIQNARVFRKVFKFRIKPYRRIDFPIALDNLFGADLFLMATKES